MNTQQPKKYNILLIGDNCLDVYQYGTVDRISPEAPVPVFKYLHEEQRPGMAGNVHKNLLALGCDVTYIHNSTSVKTRLIEIKSNQHIVRVDNDIISQPIDVASVNSSEYNAIVISDYDKGSIDYATIEYLRKDYRGPIFIDTKKKDLSRFFGCFVKINELEYSQRQSINDQLIVTLGGKGAMWKQYNEEHNFTAPKVEVSDVCGAGDTFLSALVYEYLNTRSVEDSIKFAIKASAITVQHLGVYAPTLDEILDSTY